MIGDKVELYLERVPIGFVIFAPMVALIAFLMVPSRIRLDVSIVVALVWLTFGELVALGVFHAAAKTTGFAAYLMVFVAALMDPAPKRRTPPVAWIYLFAAIQAFAYIWTVNNLALALAIRVQWAILVCAAIAVANTVVDEKSLKRIWRTLCLGFGLALLLPASELFLNPGSAFLGTGRFNPYDSNPNHIGVVFAFCPMFAGYAAMYAPRGIKKWFWLGIAALAVGCGLLTASRSTMVVMIGCSVPLVMVWVKRPALVFLGAVMLIGAIGLTMTFAENVRFVRFSPADILESKRIAFIGEHPYWPLIAERPLFGLLETEDESFLRADTALYGHPHNAYWELLYFGGFTYGIPWFLLVGYTFFCVFIVWQRRKHIRTDPLLVNLLIALMVMIYAHGFVNHALHYPTTTIAFVHVWLSTVFMSLAADLRQGRAVLEPDEPGEPDDFYDDYGYGPHEQAA